VAKKGQKCQISFDLFSNIKKGQKLQVWPQKSETGNPERDRIFTSLY